jgi:polar amino acid transport system permease protein
VERVSRRTEDRDHQRRLLIRRRDRGAWVTAVVVLVVVAWLVQAALRSHFIDFALVRKYQFSPLIMRGVRNTLIVSILAQAIGIALGVLAALVRMSKNPVAAALSSFYIWFFRGTPVLVQLFFWFNGVPSVFKTLTIAIPFTHVTLYSTPMVDFMTPFMAALLGLALNEGAYMAEIVRAGILSVDRGQVDAAHSVGMPSLMTMRRVVLPQATRIIIPPTGNELIAMLKTSSLASVITYGELLRSASDIYSTNLQPVPLLVVASIWYLAMTSVASVGQHYLERYYARGHLRAV